MGVAPRRVAGTPVPVFTPFPGKGGMGIGIINQKFISKADFFYNLAPSPWEGVFGKNAEIRAHQALHEAKPSECPKGDRDNKSEVYFINRLFYPIS